MIPVIYWKPLQLSSVKIAALLVKRIMGFAKYAAHSVFCSEFHKLIINYISLMCCFTLFFIWLTAKLCLAYRVELQSFGSAKCVDAWSNFKRARWDQAGWSIDDSEGRLHGDTESFCKRNRISLSVQKTFSAGSSFLGLLNVIFTTSVGFTISEYKLFRASL